MTEPSDKDHLRTDVGFVIGMSAAAYDLQPTDLSDVLREAADVLDDGGYDAFFAVEADYEVTDDD